MKRVTKPDYIDSLPTYSVMDSPVFSHFHDMTDSTCVKYKKSVIQISFLLSDDKAFNLRL